MASSEKMMFYLRNQSIVPVPKQKEKAEFAIAIHFDTQKKRFRFEEDKEIRRDNRSYFLAFPVGAPRDKKKLLITNTIEPLYSNIFIDSIEYLKTKRNKKTITTQIQATYDDFMREMHDTFYIHSGKKSILNRDLMASDQKEACDIIEQELFEKQKQSDPIPVEKIFKKFIEKNFSYDIQIALIKIDGKQILEIEQFREDYIQLVYYDLFDRFFIEDGTQDVLCHLCQTKTECTGKIPFPMKFFGTTNDLFFNDLSEKKQINSFAICRRCLQEVLTGMKYVANDLSDYLLGIPCYLIPALDTAEKKFEKKYKKIFKLLKTENKGYHNEIKEINDLISKSEKQSFAFSFLFYDSPPGKQEFTILKLISHLEYRLLKEYLSYFDCYNEQYNLNQFENKSVYLITMRRLLFPVPKKDDMKKYRKDLLDLFADFVYGKSVSYNMCIRRFMHVFNQNFHANKAVNRLAAFQMIIILSVLHKINPLTGVKKMSETNGKIYTKIHDARIVDFFETHKAIYENQYHRQGLFLLGTLINTIVSKQIIKRDKEHVDKTSKNLSSTFMKKLNYQGISPRRVHRLVAEVKNYAQIYDIFEPEGIWGSIMDRLQGIEMSRLNNDEIVFYILTGISFSNYLAMAHSKDKKGEK
jgi:CRISPR-associated protein Csh1